MGSFRFFQNALRRPHDTTQRSSAVQDELRRLTQRFVAAESLDLQTRRAGQLFSWLWMPIGWRSSHIRLMQWVRLVDEEPLVREQFHAAWVRMLLELDSVGLFAESGLPRHSALPAEVLRRIFQRLLPSARRDTDAGRLFAYLFSSHRSVEQFLHQEALLFERLGSLLWPVEDPTLTLRLRQHVRQALCLLAARVAGKGCSEAILQRGSVDNSVDHIEVSPFYRFVFATQTLVNEPSIGGPQLDGWTYAVSRCRDELKQVHLHMEDAGVNSALVFDLRSIEATLDRMQLLAAFLVKEPDGEESEEFEKEHQRAGRNLLSALVRGRFEDTRLTYLFQQNLTLIARKTVERTGRGGEHYIAHTHQEYAAMWRAAAGGGLLTVFTAAAKMRVLEAHLPLFVEGLSISLDYAISFILLQIFGFALATKQPSMTAATLAGIVRDNRGLARYSKISEFAADICRTQLAAAFGNVITVCIGAVAFEALWARVFKTHYLPLASAQHVYQTLHPFTSGTALFAAFTGVILWMAAMIGGWCENFVVYHRIPDAIRQHPMNQRFGVRAMHRFAAWLEENVAAYSTSVSLGFLLGFSPVIARFFGVPLDVRHVTLSTGTLALAAARFGTSSLGHGWFYYAVAGIGITFVLNLGVSFSIASTVALRAYDIPRREQMRILMYIVKDFLQSPLSFLVPAKPDILTISTPVRGTQEEA
jgi:site-specific recombinase